MTKWKPICDCLYGIAKNNFNQDDKPNRLCLDVGDAVIIVGENGHWYYGYKKVNPCEKGIFPKSYVHIKDAYVSNSEFILKRSEIVEEITIVLREWGGLFRKFYLTTDKHFPSIHQKLLKLVRLRSQILSGNLPADEIKEVKLLATSEIDTGNKLLGLDMVVRDETGNILNINDTSTTQLYVNHTSAETRIAAARIQNKNRISNTMDRHSHNLLMKVQAFVCKCKEDVDLLFTLYDGEKMKPITESYVVQWSREGLVKDLDLLDNIRVLFTDLGRDDLSLSKIYLICYAVRVGGMEIREEPKRNSVHTSSLFQNPLSSNSGNFSLPREKSGCDIMRRPFGVAFVDLTPIIKTPDAFKNELHLPFILCEKENLDNTLKKLIANKDIGRDFKLAVIVEVLHGDAKQIKEDYPHLIHGNVALARKMGFAEVIFPGDVRNDLYLTLNCAEITKSSKTSERNIEVSAAVCDDKGIAIPGVIAMGAGVDMIDEYKSVIYYHDDKPKWNEIFKIQLPIEEFKNCHMRFMFKHRSSNETKDKAEKPFAMSYVKLMQDNGTTLQDAIHRLIIYKIDYKKYDNDTKFNYLTLPSLHEIEKSSKPAAPGFIFASKDFLSIETNLCSTKLTQNVVLLGLLNWSANTDTLGDSLKALINVDKKEMVKFLPDILDALFDILVRNDNPEKYDDLVFKCLIQLIATIFDRQYSHFQSVLDLYINENFSATLAYVNLINVAQKQINNAIKSVTEISNVGGITNGQISEDATTILYETMKHFIYIMKFVIQSRILFSKLNGDKDQEVFECSLDSLFDSFTTLMASQYDMLKPQAAIFKYLHVMVNDLTISKVYEPLRLSNKIVTLLTQILPGRLNQWKMKCINNLVTSELFKITECRSLLLPVFCHQIKDKLESKEEGDILFDLWQQDKNLTKAAKILGESKSHLHSRETTAKTKIAECVNILNSMLELLFREESLGHVVDNDINDIMIILLRTVIQSSINMDCENPLVGNLVAIMLGIFRSMKETHYQNYVAHFATRTDLNDFLTEILLQFINLVSKSVFSNDWMDMIMHQNTVILESLRHFSHIIMDNFLDPFDQSVWANYFYCSIAFLIQPALQLDQFSTNKQSTILTRYKDIRRETCIEIRKMWFNLGQYKTRFVPELVGHMLEMSLIPDTEIRRTTIPIFFDMMQCEFNSSKFISESYGDTKRNITHCKGNFHGFEKKMIEQLDILVEAGRADEEYKDLFKEIMTEACMQHSVLKHDGVIFVDTVTKLLERLLEYRCLINDESKENRMACTVSLLEFYSEVNRKEMYIRYVYKLRDLHLEFKNFTEAAFTLRLHSNLLQWDENSLTDQMKSHYYSTCTTHRSLKEVLYYEIINFFDSGLMWEYAIDICKELATQYETKVYDYSRLSEIYKLMGGFYEKILKEARHDCQPTYFRVAFYGKGFQNYLRNRVFIYRGNAFEQLSEFCARILSQHPTAELLQTLTTPSQDIQQSDGQYIQINSVEPIVAQPEQFTSDRPVQVQITKFYEKNNVRTFRFSRPFREGEKTDNEIENLWLERTIMETPYSFPGILRWFPIMEDKTRIIRISPIEYAVETMESTNKSLRDLIIAHSNDSKLDLRPFGMKISGIVDPAVMGGFSKYEEAFLTDDYLVRRPSDYLLVDKLKELIALQIPLLEIAIDVHKKNYKPELADLQNHLEKSFKDLQTRIEMKYGKRTSDLKIETESQVTMRRQPFIPQMSTDSTNRLSETSVGSADSFSRPYTTINQMKTQISFNKLRTSFTPTTSKNKQKDKVKRRPSQIDKSYNSNATVPNSQWYFNSSATSLTPIEQVPSPVDSNPNFGPSSIMAVVELTEELTCKRPLRSEIEKERRLSRPTSAITTPTASIKSFAFTAVNNRQNSNGNIDNQSLSGESSNRNSTITTDSTNSEDDIPPPLPVKTRDSSDYSNLPTQEISQSGGNMGGLRHVSNWNNKPLPAIPGSVGVPNYEWMETRKRPPTPPPKPSRNSKVMQTP